MQFRLLTEVADLQLFAQIGNAAYKVDIPYQYFTKGRILGFFKDGRMVGGAAIITDGPFRGVEIIPKDQRASCGIDSIPTEQIVEINAVWLLPEVRNLYDVMGFWYRIIREIGKTKKSWVVIPYNKGAEGLHRLYKPTGMSTLFSGGGGTLPTHKNVMIGICPVPSIYKAFVIQAVKRFVRAALLRRPARGSHEKIGANQVLDKSAS